MFSEADTFVTRSPNRIGSRYKKVRYVEYTDITFSTKMLRSPEEQHLGILGNQDRAGIDCTLFSDADICSGGTNKYYYSQTLVTQGKMY